MAAGIWPRVTSRPGQLRRLQGAYRSAVMRRFLASIWPATAHQRGKAMPIVPYYLGRPANVWMSSAQCRSVRRRPELCRARQPPPSPRSDRDHSRLVIGRRDLWRCSQNKPGQNDSENAGSAPEVPRSVRIVRQLPRAGPPSIRARATPATPPVRGVAGPGGTPSPQRACHLGRINLSRGDGVLPRRSSRGRRR